MQSTTSKLFIAAALVAAAAAGATAAHAEGFYIGGSLAKPDYSSSVAGIGGTGTSSSGSSMGLKAYGGYELTPNFAVEGSVFDLGHNRDSTGLSKARGFALDGVGRYELVPHLSVLGSLGVAQGHFTSTVGDDHSPALNAGLGLQYDLNKQVAVRLEYDRYHFTNAFDAKPDIGQYTVGLNIGF